MTSPSSDWVSPHKMVEIVKPARLQNCTRPRPKFVTSQPVIGIVTAVARM